MEVRISFFSANDRRVGQWCAAQPLPALVGATHAMEAQTVKLQDEPGIADVSCALCPGRSVTIKLQNMSSSVLGFKTLTNSPKRWSVRPNGGVLEPGEVLDVFMSANTGADEDALASDRHLLLSTPLQPEEAAELRHLRMHNVRASLDILRPDNSLVHQTRLVIRTAPRGEPNGTDAIGVGTPGSVGTVDTMLPLMSPPGVAAWTPQARPAAGSAPSQQVDEETAEAAARGTKRPSVAARVAAWQNGSPSTIAVTPSPPPAESESGLRIRTPASNGRARTPEVATATPLPPHSGHDEMSEHAPSPGGLTWLLGWCVDEVEPWFKCVHHHWRLRILRCSVVSPACALRMRAVRAQVEGLRHHLCAGHLHAWPAAALGSEGPGAARPVRRPDLSRRCYSRWGLTCRR